MDNEASEVTLAGNRGSGVIGDADWSSDVTAVTARVGGNLSAAVSVPWSRGGLSRSHRSEGLETSQDLLASPDVASIQVGVIAEGGVDQLSASFRPISLTDATLGHYVRLVHQGVNGLLGHRLVDLGFTPGARMRVVRKGPAGNLIAVSIRNTVIALRSSEAKSIIVSESGG